MAANRAPTTILIYEITRNIETIDEIRKERYIFMWSTVYEKRRWNAKMQLQEKDNS